MDSARLLECHQPPKFCSPSSGCFQLQILYFFFLLHSTAISIHYILNDHILGCKILSRIIFTCWSFLLCRLRIFSICFHRVDNFFEEHFYNHCSEGLVKQFSHQCHLDADNYSLSFTLRSRFSWLLMGQAILTSNLNTLAIIL